MQKVFLLPVFVGVLFVSSAWAGDAEKSWFKVTDTSSFQWNGKLKSGHLLTVDGKKNNAYAYVYQKEDRKQKTFSYGKIFVRLDSCGRGFGYVVYNDMEGNFTGKDNFVRFGDTVADALGSVACTGWDSDTGKVSRIDSGDLWESVATAEDTGAKFSLKTDTVRKRSYKSNSALTALFSYENVKKDTTEYSEYVIQLADCKKGFGTIYELDFDGNLVQKSSVVLDGSSMIAAVANSLCAKL